MHMTQICVSLGESTTLGIVDRMADLAAVADLFEIRGDRVLDLDLLAILRAKTRQLLFTCRGASEGGGLEDADSRRRDWLREAMRRGFEYVDVEYRSGLLDLVLNMTPGFFAGLLLGWDPEEALLLGGVTYISSSGIIAKLLSDLGRMGNRETPAVISVRSKPAESFPSRPRIATAVASFSAASSAACSCWRAR